jgi:hypothetical protein
MKKTWLQGLKGLSVGQAETKVIEAGLAAEVLEKGAMRMAMIVAKTVFLYKDAKGLIDSVEVGDVGEIEG